MFEVIINLPNDFIQPSSSPTTINRNPISSLAYPVSYLLCRVQRTTQTHDQLSESSHHLHEMSWHDNLESYKNLIRWHSLSHLSPTNPFTIVIGSRVWIICYIDRTSEFITKKSWRTKVRIDEQEHEDSKARGWGIKKGHRHTKAKARSQHCRRNHRNSETINSIIEGKNIH